jgi:hypothetical protein
VGVGHYGNFIVILGRGCVSAITSGIIGSMNLTPTKNFSIAAMYLVMLLSLLGYINAENNNRNPEANKRERYAQERARIQLLEQQYILRLKGKHNIEELRASDPKLVRMMEELNQEWVDKRKQP